MGVIPASTPTSCADYTLVVEGLLELTRRVAVD